MNEYSDQQSILIALWVLSLRPNFAPGPEAPEFLTQMVNALGEHHSAASILLHTHGYERLFLNRPINRNITSLQRQVASLLRDEGIVEHVFDQ